jgi:hypothetical protein
MITVLPYFETQMNTLGYTKWFDAFNDAIPDTKLNKKYWLNFREVSIVKQNQSVIDADWSVELNTYVKAYKKTSDGLQDAIVEADKIIKKICNTYTRSTQTTIKNIKLDKVEYKALDESNDNIVHIVMNFNISLIIETS